MPIARDISGRTTYVPAAEFYRERPEDFFLSDPNEYWKRITRARARVLEAVRFASVPLNGRGLCHEVHMDPSIENFTEQLTNFVDQTDGRRAEQVRRQHKQKAKSGLTPNQRRLRSPQDVKRRRSALFSGKDIPADYFGKRTPSQTEIDRFVELMRWYLLEAAITAMRSEHQLELINSTWYVPVSFMDVHRLPASGRHRVKFDDRSFHGRPNRDRALVAA